MGYFFDHYQAGKHEWVWREMTYLDLRVPETLADAQLVANETMRRVNHNIDILIPRIQSLGYAFGYDWLKLRRGTYSSAEIEEHVKLRPVHGAPQLDAHQKLDQLGKQRLFAPFSLIAWYEIVGSVNFVGTPPESWMQCLQSRSDPGGLEYLDPLNIDPLWDWAIQEVGRHPYEKRLPLADDHIQKYEHSGGLYAIDLGEARPHIDERFHTIFYTSFVDFLRIALSWGGFPGIALLPRRPEKDIAYLTDGLLAF